MRIQKGCKAIQTKIVRVEVVGPIESREATFDDLYDEGFTVTRSGPYTDRNIFPKVDPERFCIVAEKMGEQ